MKVYRLSPGSVLRATFFLLLTATAASAQSIVFELFQNDYSADGSTDATALGVEFQTPPFIRSGSFTVRLGAGVTADLNGNVWLGVGPDAQWDFAPRWFAEASVMPGFYHASGTGFDLGGDLEFRSTLGLGYRIDDRNAVSLSLRHISNGDTGPRNPGLNAIGLRFHHSF